MNPLLISEIAKSPATAKAIDVVADTQKDMRRVRNGILIGLSGLLLIWGGYKIYRNIQKSKTSQSDEPDAVAAKKLLLALSPSGTGLKWLPDGTDEVLLFNTAYEINKSKIPYAQVAKRYKDLTGRELDGDLRSDLSPEEYERFIKIVNNPDYEPSNDEDNPDYYTGKLVYSGESFGLRKQYKDITAYKILPAGSCISNAKSTGRIESFVGNFGTRIEMKTDQNVVFWVSKTDIQLFLSLDDMPKNKRTFRVLK